MWHVIVLHLVRFYINSKIFEKTWLFKKRSSLFRVSDAEKKSSLIFASNKKSLPLDWRIVSALYEPENTCKFVKHSSLSRFNDEEKVCVLFASKAESLPLDWEIFSS